MFDRSLCDYFEPARTVESAAVLDGIVAASRRENQAAAHRLRSVGDLFELRRAERGEEENWAVDTWAAVAAEIAAALRISLGKASSHIHYGRAMRRLPAVTAVFLDGDIDMQTFATIVYRTDLITDRDVLADVDRRIAVWVARATSMSRGRQAREIDRIIATVDPDAVRRAGERARDRDVTVWDNQDGTADVAGRLFGPDAHLLDKRLDALAATVCEADPRTAGQRRADALGALAAGAERLMCRCGSPTCPATAATASRVVIHVVADQATLDGHAERPGYLMGANSLVPAEMLRDLAATANLRPLVHPSLAEPEPRYRPSRGLADFIRARDLTCRAPGCDRPATECDIDHTIAFGQGGATHASNMKCLCRLHHLLKTFWGWKDRQLPDGTVIWTLPDNRTYITTPGSALLFPTLMTPTGDAPQGHSAQTADSDRTAMMPRRATTRAANRAHRIAAERAHNNRERRDAPF